MTFKAPLDEVETARREFMAGLAPVGVFAEAIGKSKRTVERLIAAGELPIIKVGRTPYVNVAGARAARLGSHSSARAKATAA
jgi:hypothetical protein